MIYGLGETMRGINKRGYRYISFNYDDPHHKDDMPSMYGAHNFFVVDGEEFIRAAYPAMSGKRRLLTVKSMYRSM